MYRILKTSNVKNFLKVIFKNLIFNASDKSKYHISNGCQ